MHAAYAACTTDTEREQLLARWDAEDDARDARLHADDALAAAATWYAEQGIAIFPCEPAGKRPLGRLAPNGCKNASTDVEQVRAWWTAEPQANIGIATGHRFDVIDIDGPPGYRSLLDLEPLPALAQAVTGSGGRHIYVPATGRGNGAKLRPGIDYRGAGGYVIAPPSRHSSGRLYTWIDAPTALLHHLAAA